MTQTRQVKDFYAILGATPEANQAQIQEAYNRLAVECHPQKNHTDNLSAQKKFKDICEAYEVLSNKSKKAHYDHLIKSDFTLQQAEKTFEEFYHQFGVENEEERDFFEENYPHTTKDYYQILGVSRNATLEEIQDAYRKFAIKHHPKKHGDNEEAKHKFIEMSEAYNALSCQKKRNQYNNIAFKSLEPIKAHEIFEDFFSDKAFRTPQDQEFFRPLVQQRWIKNLDKIMNDNHHQNHHECTQIKKEHEVYSNKNGVETRKIVKENKKVKDGKVHHQIIEEYILPNGEKEIRKTIKDGGEVHKEVRRLKHGEDIVRQVENGNSQHTHQKENSKAIENCEPSEQVTPILEEGTSAENAGNAENVQI